MESPHKRLKQSPPESQANEDFVPLGGGEEDNQYGYSTVSVSTNGFSNHAPTAPRQHRNAWNTSRNAKDRPKSKHALPGHEPWILVKTRYGRRFVHNTATKESFWHIPHDLMPAIHDFERWEVQEREKTVNAKWAEEQLKEMRDKSKAGEVNEAANKDPRNRRRRSESLQREDEEAMMAELAAEAERAEEKDIEETVKAVEHVIAKEGEGAADYNSDSSYEEVEVTDSEFEDEDHTAQAKAVENGATEQPEDGLVEFGEDDIAYQLAAMGKDYGLEQDEMDEEYNEYADDENPPLGEAEAAQIFRSLLDSHNISPFTPWDKLISDTSSSSIVLDDRYTILPNMRARKEVWESWVKDTAARLKEERAQMEKQDPRIPYLRFLAEKASTKLYWPEFKRKFKDVPEMKERKMSDKEREKLYREHVNRLKLPESTRKADLVALLRSLPLRDLNKETTIAALPQGVLAHLHYYSLPTATRERVVEKHIASLPPPPSQYEGEGDAAPRGQDTKREAALEARARQVEQERRKAEKEERWAKRGLLEEERELRRAMAVGDRGLKGQLSEKEVVR